ALEAGSRRAVRRRRGAARCCRPHPDPGGRAGRGAGRSPGRRVAPAPTVCAGLFAVTSREETLMCGIVGIAGSAGRPVDDAVLRSMNDAIWHRGPDDDGYLVRDRVGLGMRRLSIIDVAGGRQPIHNEDKSVWAVFNGEIYNYAELRDDLQRRGHHFNEPSNTETIVHLYEEYGDEGVSRLRGMFAYALWDER